MRIKICRKEAKESAYWLALIDVDGDISLEKQKNLLKGESMELVKIFNAILTKVN